MQRLTINSICTWQILIVVLVCFQMQRRGWSPKALQVTRRRAGYAFLQTTAFCMFVIFVRYFNLTLTPDSATAWVKIAGADTVSAYFNQYVSLHLAHDQKIYIGNVSTAGSTMSVINNPNGKGTLADFCPKCMRYPAWNGMNISVTQPPNMPNYVLGPTNPLCKIDTTDTTLIAWHQYSQPPFTLYPNPATTSITVEYAQGGKLEIVDMLGRVQLSTILKANGKTTDERLAVSSRRLYLEVYNGRW